MAARLEIQVDVNSTEFQAFAAQFAKYADALKNIPATWKTIEGTAARAKTHFESAADSVATTAGSMAAIQKSGSEFYHVTTSTARHWKDLAYSTGSVAKNIVAATESLLKWGGLLGIVTGAGGLFGFDRLSQSVSGQRTGALGVGTDYASRAAFLTNFHRLGDPEGLLGRVSEDVSSMGPQLRRLGLSPAEMKGDTADVAIKALRKGAEIAAKTRQDLLDVVPQLQIFSHEERMRLKAHPEEIEEMAGKFREDRKGLGLSAADQKAYTDFTTQMERAGREIETIFVKGLVKLADPLSKLSAEVLNLVDRFMAKDGPLDELITELSKGIEWLAGEIDKPEFQKTVNDFIAGIGDLAVSLGGLVKGLADFSKWLGVSPASAAESSTKAAATSPEGMEYGPQMPGHVSRRGATGGGGAGGVATSPEGMEFGPQLPGHVSRRGATGGNVGDVDHSGSKEGSLTSLIDFEARAAGVDPRIMEGIRAGESGHGSKYDIKDDALESSWGPFQLNRKRGLGVEFEKDTGLDVRDPTTIAAQTRWVAEYLKTHHGDTSPWKGFHGPRNADPKWGESGYKPDPNSITTNKPKVTLRSSPGNNVVDAANAASAGSP